MSALSHPTPITSIALATTSSCHSPTRITSLACIPVWVYACLLSSLPEPPWPVCYHSVPLTAFTVSVCVCLFAQLVLCSLYRQHQPNPAAVLPDIEPVRNEGPTLQCENKLQLSMNNCITSTSLCQSNGNTYTRMRTHERTQTLT